MLKNKYFSEKSRLPSVLIGIFLAFLFTFSVLFFLWSSMRFNKSKEIKKEKAAYIEQLNDEVKQLRYLVDAPLDDAYKIRIAREKLGMCFPDEIVFHTDFE